MAGIDLVSEGCEICDLKMQSAFVHQCKMLVWENFPGYGLKNHLGEISKKLLWQNSQNLG